MPEGSSQTDDVWDGSLSILSVQLGLKKSSKRGQWTANYLLG